MRSGLYGDRKGKKMKEHPEKRLNNRKGLF